MDKGSGASAETVGARIVVRLPNWLGDAVLALPALAAMRRHFKDAHLTVAGPTSVASLFRETATDARPDTVLDLPSSSRAATTALRQGKFTAGILMPNSFRSAWQFYRAGVPDRSGFATAGRGLLLTHRIARPKGASLRHHSDYYRALVRGLQIPCADDELPRVSATTTGIVQANELLAKAKCPPAAPIVVVMPGAANSQAKQWPPERMAEVAARLVRERGAVCVLAGAAHDRPASRAIESWLRERAPETSASVIDLVGLTSLGVLAGVLDRSVLCVSNDAGGMHLASAIGRPVVAIFGPTDERSTRPAGDHDLIVESVFCRPCMLRDCPIDHRCMKRIPVERVFEAASKRLSRGAR